MQGDVSPISYNHETTGGSVGPSEFCIIPGPSREASSETTPALDESPYFSRIKGQIRGFRKVFQKGFGNLANITVPSDSSPDVSTSSVPSKLMTDASSQGWGAALLPDRVSGTWPPEFQDWSINQLELMAIFHSLEQFCSTLQGNPVLIMSDNSTAVACIRNQGTQRSVSLLDLSRKLLEFCEVQNITPILKHLAGKLNVLVDQESCLAPVHTDWTLDQATFNSIWNRNGSFGCDLFATRFNKKLENLDIEGLITNYLMRGISIYRPPQKTKEMLRWSLDLVLDYLKSDSFEPLESANLTLLTQKALFLILLASGRRKGEIANLSRDFIRHDDSSVELVWVPSFLPKHHTPDFQPAYPSISRLNSSRVTDRLLCPVRAYITYLDRSQIWWDRNQDDEHHTCLWTIPSSTIRASPDYLSNLIGALVGESRRFSGEPSVEVGIHQIRKLAASHSIQACQNEQTIKEKMGFSEVNILRKNYIAQVSNLKVACVLPGGTFISKRAHDLSESDSD